MAKRFTRRNSQKLNSARSEQLEARCLLSATPAVYYDNGTPHDPSVPEAYQIGSRWTSTATNASTGSTGQGMTLTWSIVPDGTLLGSGEGEPNAGSTLRADLNALYGSQANWLPIIQQVFNEWSSISGVTYVYEPNDDGVAFSSSNNGILGTRGDVRIGAHPIDGAYGTLAYNWSPGYGDMVIDSNDLTGSGYMTNLANESRRLRNVMAHEHGHGLGFNHVDPVNGTKLMEATASTSFDGPQFDDMLAVNRNYGDIYEKGAGDNTAASAVNFGTLTVGQPIQNASLSTTSDVDYYKFTLSTAKDTSITVLPFGPTYLQGPQGGSVTSFNAQAQMDLEFQLIASNGTTVLATVNATGVGSAESTTFSSLAAGTYYLKVLPAPAAADSAQMYNATISLAGAVTPTTLVGLDTLRNLTITDIAAKNDALTLSTDAANSRWIITDPNNYLGTLIPSATGNGTHTVYVPYSAVTGPRIVASLLDGSDSMTVTGTTIPVTIDPGAGADTITVTDASAAAPVSVVPSAGSDTVSVNADNTGTATVHITGGAQLNTLTIGAGGRVIVDAADDGLSLNTLSLNASGALDLNDNDLAINTAAFSDIHNSVVAGYRDSPDTAATGIISTISQDTGGKTILLLLDNSYIGVTDWPSGSGHSVSSNAVLGKYTYFGDTNIDGQITGDDYGAIDANLGATGIPPGVAVLAGDTNSDNAVTGDDYSAIDANLGLGAGNPLGSPAALSVSTLKTSPAALVIAPQSAAAAPTLQLQDKELKDLLL